MSTRAATEYRYEKLTWPEINDAVELGKVCIVPCGAVEQHGPHLPLDVDLVCPLGIANGAGRAIPDKILVLPILAYGYTGHVMDFPGTINTHYETFIKQVLDVTKSLAYHGFKRIVLLKRPRLEHAQPRPGRPPDQPRDRRRLRRRRLVEPADRRQGVSAELAREQIPRRLLARLRTGDVDVPLSRRRQRPQRQDQERHDLDQRRREPLQLRRPLRRRARPRVVSWTSSYSETGVLGDAEKATKEKGERAYNEAVKQLVRFVEYFQQRPRDRRHREQRTRPTMPMPWGQRDEV